MQRSIKIGDKEIDYKIKKSKRAKRVRIAVYCDASVVVTMPYRVSENVVEKFLREKADWLFKKISLFLKRGKSELVTLGRDDYLRKKEEARKIVQEIIEKHNKNNKFGLNRVSIRNQKTRWGSCSRKRNININYKIVYLPRIIAEYIVVHELCHLKEFNHSRRFWAHVEAILPNCKELRRELKHVGLSL